SQNRDIETVMRDHTGVRDCIGDSRAWGKFEADHILDGWSRPDDRYLHGGAACSDSARRTNASMNVLAMWPNTGPKARSRSGVAKSQVSSKSTRQADGPSATNRHSPCRRRNGPSFRAIAIDFGGRFVFSVVQW